MKDGIVIQARTGSTRMPAKILQPFDGKTTILDIIIQNIKRDNPEIPLIVATTDKPADDAIVLVAKRHSALCFRGSEDDVLQRFIGAADAFGLDRIIRVCSDNPFLQTNSFATLIAEADNKPDADYVAFAFPDGRPTIKSHLGMFAELVAVDALRRVVAMTADKLAHEHVTIHLYTHPDSFNIHLLSLPEVIRKRTDIRLTVDTPADFQLLNELYHKLHQSLNPSVHTLLELIDSNAEYGRIMKHNIAQNEK